jgi:hypothetical protein
MLKALEDLGKPDPRYVPGTPLDDVIGQRIEDLHAHMRPLELLPSVPDEVRWQLDAARNCFVYSWYCRHRVLVEHALRIVRIAPRGRIFLPMTHSPGT